MVRHFGEPFGDSSALPMWHLASLARQHVTVALNGDGGDEVLAGYPWYQTALRLDVLGRPVPTPLLWMAARIPGARAARLRRLAGRLLLEPGPRFAALRRVMGPDVKAQLYTPGFLATLTDAAETYHTHAFARVRAADDLTRMQYTDLCTYLPDDLLVKVDRMTMAHSLEARSPFLDHEVVEFCLRLPPALRLDRSGGKALLREVAAPLFPPRFLERPKMGFSVPLAQWLRGELRPLLHDWLGDPAFLDRGWFRRDALERLVDTHVSGRRDESTLLWTLLMLGGWSRFVG
jgi:asparagine synthase (glutamine-hydrolysing)